jgi:hypothetical protein
MLEGEAGVDPKLVADQLGHGLGVNLDVYDDLFGIKTDQPTA